MTISLIWSIQDRALFEAPAASYCLIRGEQGSPNRADQPSGLLKRVIGGTIANARGSVSATNQHAQSESRP